MKLSPYKSSLLTLIFPYIPVFASVFDLSMVQNWYRALDNIKIRHQFIIKTKSKREIALNADYLISSMTEMECSLKMIHIHCIVGIVLLVMVFKIIAS